MRSKFTLIQTPEVRVTKHGGRLVNLHLWPFCGEISHLLKHFRQVLTSKRINEHQISPVGADGLPLADSMRPL